MDPDPPDTPLPISITLSDAQPAPVDTARIVRMARRTAQAEGAEGEISITLVDADRMAELNARYTGKRGPTDVLSFPIDGPQEAQQGPRMIGELVLCPQVALAQAPAGDLAGELDLLTAHGVLHLLGHDHDTKAGAERMREKERALTGRAGATFS